MKNSKIHHLDITSPTFNLLFFIYITATDGEEAEESDKEGNYDKKIMPEFIFCLEANDEFLRNRVMNLPESVVHGTHNTETELNRRLIQYRNNNDEENTVLTYFDEREIDPIKIDVTKDESVMMKDTVEKMKKVIGGARNYGEFKLHCINYSLSLRKVWRYQKGNQKP